VAGKAFTFTHISYDAIQFCPFLHAPMQLKDFFCQAVIEKPFQEQDPRAITRLNAVLGSLMLRRTKVPHPARHIVVSLSFEFHSSELIWC